MVDMKHEVEKAWLTCGAFSLGLHRKTRSKEILAIVAGNRDSITPVREEA